MNTHAKSNNSIGRFGPESARKNLRIAIDVIGVILEYCFVIHIGAITGWFLGLFFGKIYTNYFEPVYFPGPSEVTRWLELPYGFARHGAIFGVTLGIIVMSILIIKEHACSHFSFEEPENCLG